jgi:hypothetical protein
VGHVKWDGDATDGDVLFTIREGVVVQGTAQFQVLPGGERRFVWKHLGEKAGRTSMSARSKDLG